MENIVSKNDNGIEFEDTSEGAVLHNLDMLQHAMTKLLLVESMGGNAGAVTIDGIKYACAAANGYANPETGEIVVFGNSQNIDDDIIKNNMEFTLRVAVDIKRLQGARPSGSSEPFFNIVNFLGKEYFVPSARRSIESAIERYNELNK